MLQRCCVCSGPPVQKLLTDDEDNESIRQHVVMRRAVAVPGGDGKYVVRFRIQGGGASARVRVNFFYNTEFVGRIFVNDGESSGASGGGEGSHGGRVEDAGVGARAWSRSLQHCAGVGVR